MPIPWLAALQLVPWSQVIEHAPKVLAKAQELLRRRNASAAETANRPPAEATEFGEDATDPARLARRIAVLEQQIEAQRQQLDQQAQMLGELAEQSASLIAAVEMQRRRIGWLRFGLYGLALALLLLFLSTR